MPLGGCTAKLVFWSLGYFRNIGAVAVAFLNAVAIRQRKCSWLAGLSCGHSALADSTPDVPPCRIYLGEGTRAHAKRRRLEGTRQSSALRNTVITVAGVGARDSFRAMSESNKMPPGTVPFPQKGVNITSLDIQSTL
jgi:hypothetical protein